MIAIQNRLLDLTGFFVLKIQYSYIQGVPLRFSRILKNLKKKKS